MGLDSVELVMDIEKWFAISIPDPEAEKAYTIGRMVNCVGNLVGKTNYDFTLREKVFDAFRSELLGLKNDSSDFRITDITGDYFPANDADLLRELESRLGYKLPGVNTKIHDQSKISGRIRSWFTFTEKIDFNQLRWKSYIDILIAYNLDKLIARDDIRSKYEIYIVIMRLTVDKTGVDYSEIALEKSFADDLGID